MEGQNDRAAVIACDFTAMSDAQRARYGEIRREMEAALEELRDLPDGYALRFPAGSSLIALLAEFITLERLCCPFLTFSLVVEADGGPAWLRLTGDEGVKAFLQTEFVAPTPGGNRSE